MPVLRGEDGVGPGQGAQYHIGHVGHRVLQPALELLCEGSEEAAGPEQRQRGEGAPLSRLWSDGGSQERQGLRVVGLGAAALSDPPGG